MKSHDFNTNEKRNEKILDRLGEFGEKPTPTSRYALEKESAAERLKKEFRKFDNNNSGTIDRWELQRMLKNLTKNKGGVVSEDDVEMVMAVADTNGDGVIEYDEFIEWVMKPSTRVRESNGSLVYFDLKLALRPLFDAYDRNGNGYITQAEFEECHCIVKNSVLLHPGTVGEPKDPAVLKEDMEELFRKIDGNHNRKISFEEFVDWQRTALAESGLSGGDVQDMIPALAKQLQIVFRMSDLDQQGNFSKEDDQILRRVVESIAHSARDLWNRERAAVCHDADSAFQNRWSEPPIGLNLDRLKALHLMNYPPCMFGPNKIHIDLEVFCVPQLCDEGTEHDRIWFAELFRIPQSKAGVRAIELDEYYAYDRSTFQWNLLENGKQFEEALSTLTPALKMFCLLKSEANMGTHISWHCVQKAFSFAVAKGYVSEEHHQVFNNHLENKVKNFAMREGLSECDVSEATMNRTLKLAPRSVMATLSELGIFKVCGTWVDFMDYGFKDS